MVRSNYISLHIGCCVFLERVIKTMVAVKGSMTKFLAYLANETRLRKERTSTTPPGACDVDPWRELMGENVHHG
jgi:hypothetical protein